MSQPEIDRLSARRILSALADGDATDSEAARAFQAWREDDGTRVDWHTYQLIGDVLRSDDLAAVPADDESFLVALRQRLAAEPVVLAPVQPAALETQPSAVAPARASSRSRGRWQAPLAVAAGFLAMIGGLQVLHPFGHTAPDAAVALAGGTVAGNVGGPVVSTPANGLAAGTATTKADNEQLAPYLAAHRQSTMSGAFQMPGGDIRNVSLVQTAR